MQHLDEGTIHAWLDGALTAEEAARVERHASACAECAAVVAEARGLVAGASRILSALDDVPAVAPAGSGRRAAGGGTSVAPLRPPPSAQRAPARRPLWSRPAALAAAAGVVLMAGSALVLTKSGGRQSLVTRQVADSAALISAPRTTEEAAEAPTAGAAADAQATEGGGRDTLSRAATGSGVSRPTAAPQPRPSTQSAVSNASRRRPAESRGFAQAERAAAVAGNVATQQLMERAPQEAEPQPPRADTGFQARADIADRRAPETTDDRRARQAQAAPRAPSRQAVAATGADAPPTGGRADTVYRVRVRADTITVSRVDTIIVDPPTPYQNLRGAERARVARAFPVTGCYEVLEGRLPRSITLTGTRVWSGAAEQRFVANAPGEIGYWSQPSTGNVHVEIAGALVTARIDASTGELRGKALRGGKTERFVARRGCR